MLFFLQNKQTCLKLCQSYRLHYKYLKTSSLFFKNQYSGYQLFLKCVHSYYQQAVNKAIDTMNFRF